MEPVRSFCKDSLAVRIYADRTAMGAAAARDGAALLRRLLAQQDTVRAVFAAAPSQNEFLEALCAAPDIDWKRVTAFHMDEYVGLDAAAPQGFGNFLRARVFDRFVRLDTARSRKGGGSGLGLAIVAEIIAHHDGSITIGDRPGGGALITVTLPSQHPTSA